MRENTQYSEYTLEKVKNFILKHVDKIELIGEDMYLYFHKNDNFKFFKQNNSIIKYIWLYTFNGGIECKKIEKSIKKEHKLKKCSILIVTTQKGYGLTYAR